MGFTSFFVLLLPVLVVLVGILLLLLALNRFLGRHGSSWRGRAWVGILLRAAWAWLGAFLMRRWLYVFGASVLVVVILQVVTGKKSQDATTDAKKVATENRLTKKQVKQAEQVIAQQFDSIRVRDAIIYHIVQVRDSAVVAARHHDARADSVIKTIVHETIPADADATPSRVFDRLSSYRPGAYALGEGDSIR